ncbi:UDP-N-acetylmuramoyl-tripeptide--D-alanyl-D-alanine ligase [Haloflavibacter putidus]|uniref:UDP-N-acetylmuramoyl-tripeptide--D-alanyl-D-alanine ligase n=1 Tax=Haloflavibacter putidus TaxID=2576776 RepID=A0A507ZB83_9FLAO|nr:UDP-N-acetylmuramoyl-tripeptide--D-alanyl-D-alanine ligase [Haloflavibacter putidus]TQD34349.1 UDP-N-acetylmuramoyl-tripeptide--D-alanyl-D-alanine ligase [Haloflavibacter putidus]
MTTTSEIHQLFLNSSGVCTDTRKLKSNQLFFALKGENFNANTFAEKALDSGASYAVVDEEKYVKNSRCILVHDVLESLQNLANYHRNYLNLNIIAITGSNGKTTTKELVKAVLSKKYKVKATSGNLNNHIGVPLTLLEFTKETEVGIVEMGANHQKEIENLCKIAEPDFGYITNFGKAHLEGFGGFEGVIKGKSELYTYLRKKNATIFINRDDDLQVKQSEFSQVISFSEGKSADFQITFLEADPFVKLCYNNTTLTSRLIGVYNAKNLSAAVAIGLYFKVPDKQIKIALEEYTPSNNRSQLLNKNKLKIILDAYNANPTSMTLALQNLKGLETESKSVILGDMLEIGEKALEEHQAIVDKLSNLHLDNVFLIGSYFSKTKTSSAAKKFIDWKDFANHLEKNPIKTGTVLIKGSRKMALERSLDYL